MLSIPHVYMYMYVLVCVYMYIHVHMYVDPKVIPRLHDDGTVRNGSAWHGTERLSSNVYTCLWLCGIEWFLKAIP